MEYIVVGPGTMPVKEIRAVVADIMESDPGAVFGAVISGPITTENTIKTVESVFKSSGFLTPSEASETLALYLDEKNHDEALDAMLPELASLCSVYEWDADELFSYGESSGWPIKLLVLAPQQGTPYPQELTDLIRKAIKHGIPAMAFNEQMYELTDSEPESDDLQDLSRDQLKAMALRAGVTAEDWRSKDSIIEALAGTVPEIPAEMPLEAAVSDSPEILGVLVGHFKAMSELYAETADKLQNL